MKKPFLFEYKISGSMFIVFILVSIIGIYTYQRYSKIVELVNDASRPDVQLLTLKGLRNDLSDAENSIKSYSLTQDAIFLSHFDETLDKVDNKLIRLNNLPETSIISDTIIDTLSTLIDEKFEVLNELLSLQNKFTLEETFDKVSSEIEDVVSDTEKTVILDQTAIAIEKSTKRKWRLFNRHEKEEVERIDTIQKALLPDELLTDVNNRLEDIKRQELNASNRIIDHEIQLILDDRELTERIRSILDQIEQLELDKIAEETEVAKVEVEKANAQIFIFCIAIGILLLFMTYTIINYVQNNNRYRIILAKAKQQAEDLADTKARFITNMSHEIRTPMNAIAGFTEQLAESPLNEQQTNQLSIVRKSADHLLHLINEILDLSKLQQHKLKLESSPFLPSEIINDVSEFFSLKLEQSKLALKVTMENAQDTTLLGDPFRLRQILLNLISNSIKFTSAGEISIGVKTIQKNDSNLNLIITIKDSGIGMSAEQLERVFEEFEQAEIITSKKYGGTGLGLAITKQLIELQNGEISIKSEQNIGTEITFEIPYKIAPQASKSQEKQPAPISKSLEGIKILIVDDEPFNRKLLCAILKKEKVLFTEATNGQEAIFELEKANFDLVLMDMRMPIMNGVEASKAIRKSDNKNISTTPIIALTAAVTVEDRADYESAGMDGFVSKPFQKDTVLNEINKVLEMQNSKESQNNPAVKIVDFTELKNLSTDSPEFYSEMLETFIHGTSEGIVGIEKSLADNNWSEMAEWAHRISSPCKHLEANTLYQYLKSIEDSCRKNINLERIPVIVEKAKTESIVVIKLVRQELEKSNN